VVKTSRDTTGDLAHVLVCAGTIAEWLETTPNEWKLQIDALVKSVGGVGVRWLSIYPYSGHANATERSVICNSIISVFGGQRPGDRVSVIGEQGLMVVVDTCADGQERFVNAVAQLGSQEIDEDKLAATLLAPASGEPDLVLILGSPTQVPESLMWELAYSELVFLNVPWLRCDVEHIQMAIDDFQRRDRRFGGVDS
jgi:undecaprenyl diphosphate synthase